MAPHLLGAEVVAPGNRFWAEASGVCGRATAVAAPHLVPLGGPLGLCQTRPRRVVLLMASSPQKDPRERSFVWWKLVDPAPPTPKKKRERETMSCWELENRRQDLRTYRKGKISVDKFSNKERVLSRSRKDRH